MAELDELRAFLAVIDAGSVKAAAVDLGVPRSTLRRRLESLEQRVGVALLWTDATGAYPTPAARLLLSDGASLLESYGSLVDQARRAAKRPYREEGVAGSDDDDGRKQEFP
jgi:DNA-binding transcriptional LysR family regulator